MKVALKQALNPVSRFLRKTWKTQIFPLYCIATNKKIVRGPNEVQPIRRSCVFTYNGQNGSSMSFHLPNFKGDLQLSKKTKFPLPHDPSIKGVVKGKSIDLKKGVETFRVECKIGKPITHQDLISFSDFMCKKGGWRFQKINPASESA
jgi:hypothetical protein